MSTKKERLKKASHFLNGFIILMHAYERYESHHQSYIFFLVSGLLFISIAAFHHQLEKRFKVLDVVFVLIEALLTLIIAYEYFDAGKRYIPYIYLFAGVLRIASAFILYKKDRKLTT